MSFLNLFTNSDSGTILITSVLNFKLNNPTLLPQEQNTDRIDSSAFKKTHTFETSLEKLNPKTAEENSMDKIVSFEMTQMEERQRLINQYLQLNIRML